MAAWGVMDDESIAEGQTLIGTELEPWNTWVTEASFDNISHFTEGIGDDNPLFNDREYALKSRWGALLAPPTMLYAVELPGTSIGLPGVQPLYAGSDWTWYDYVRERDPLHARSTLVGLDPKSGRFAKLWVLEKSLTKYCVGTNVVGEAVGYMARLPAPEPGAQKYEKREQHQYSRQELADIEAAVLGEVIRGAKPRYWEDVAVGDELPVIVRGPLTPTDLMAAYAGMMGARPTGGPHARGIRWKRATGNYQISKTTGQEESVGSGHMDADVGEDIGVGGAFDIAPARICWGASMVTNWISDEGFLHQHNVKVIMPNLIGDTTWWHGTVVDKRRSSSGHAYVTVKGEARNQLGQVTAAGQSVAILPSRESGPVTLPVSGKLVAL